MAEQPINKDDLIKSGTIEKIIKEFQDWEIELTKIDETIKRIAKSTPEIKQPNNTEDFVKLSKEIERLEGLLKKQVETKKNLSDIDRERLKLDKQLENSTDEAVKGKIRFKAASAEQNKLLKAEITLNNKLAGTEEKLLAANVQLRIERSKLIQGNLGYEDSLKRINSQLDKNNAEIHENSDALAKQKMGIGGYTKSIFNAGLQLIGFTSAISILKSAFTSLVQTNRDFNKSISSLSSLTGAVGKDLEFYKEQAKEIGATTTLSSSQAVDAFRLIGSQRPELLKNAEALARVTKEAVILAEASGLELPEAATALTTSLNQMNASASESSRFINVLAAGSKEGAGDIPYLNDAIEKSGAVARDANLSFEELVGAIETIAPSVAEPSSAGLKLSNVLLRLQENGKGFVSGKFNLKDALEQVSSEFDAMTDPVKRAQAESKLFGKESIIVGKALLNNIDVYGNFTQAVTGTSTALDQQRTNVDNLDGDLKAFDHTVEAVSLGVSGEGGLFRSFVQVSTELLKLVFGLSKADKELTNAEKSIKSTAKTVLILLKAITILKTAYLAYGLGVKVSNAYTAISTTVTGLFSKAKIIETAAVNGATAATKSFNAAAKANPLGLVIALIAAAVTAYLVFRDSVTEAEKAQLAFNKGMERADEIVRARIENQKTLTNSEVKAEEERIRRLKALGGNEKALDKELFENKKAILEKDNKLREQELIDVERNGKKIVTLKKAEIIAIDKLISEGEKNISGDKYEQQIGLRHIENLQKKRRELSLGLKETQGEVVSAVNVLKENIALVNSEIASADTDLLEVVNENTKDFSEAHKNRTEELDLLAKRLRDSKVNLLENDLTQEIERIKNKFNDEINLIKGQGETEEALRVSLNLEMLKAIDESTEKYKVKSKKLAPAEPIEKDIKLKKSSSIAEIVAPERAKAEENKKIEEELLKSLTSSATLFTSLYSQQIDEAIEGQNRLISNSQRTIDSIKQAAIAGNLEAKNSILAEEKAIEESQKRIEKAQKQKQRMEMISSGINMFNAKVAGGTNGIQALAETGAAMSGLMMLLNGLPSFAVGADRLGKHGNIDGNGGFLAINHPDERILTAHDNKLIGYDTPNSEVANVMSYYNKGLLKPLNKIQPMILQQDNTQILKGIENGFSKINNWNISVEQLFSQVSVIVEKSKGGDIHKYKKTFK